MAGGGGESVSEERYAGTTFALRLVVFLRASFLYPADHGQVIETCRDLLSCIGEYEGDTVTMRALGRGLLVNGREADIPAMQASWVREKLLRAGLVGVEILPGVDREALARFAECLRTRGEWPGFERIRPLLARDREGGRGGTREGARLGPAGWPSAAGARPPGSRLPPGSLEYRLCVHLASEPDIRQKASRLLRSMEREVEIPGIHDRFELLAEIVRLLPAEASRDPAVARKLVEQVLSVFLVGQGGEASVATGEHPPRSGGIARRIARRVRGVCEARTAPAPARERDDSSGVDRPTTLDSSGEPIDLDEVVRGFPARFDLFLNTLSPVESRDRDRLAHVVEQLPPGAVTAADEALGAEGGVLTRARAEMILSVSTPRMLSLVRVLAGHGDAEILSKVVRSMRRMEIPEAEGAALRAVDPPTLLPRAYLQDLCRFPRWGDGVNLELREYSSFLLRKFIADLAGDSKRLERRIYAIRALRSLPSPETVRFLEHLSRSGRLLSRSRDARSIRQVALRTLKEIIREGERLW